MPLLRPADGLPDVVADAGALERTAAAFAAGSGPVAVDAERASGFRYSQRAYLVQLRRAGAGSALIDPIPLGSDLSALSPALTGPEWVLHAASQDLPCLAEVGLAPTSLFDTELAGRLAGLPRVGLGPMVEQLLGLALEKGHGAADWSRRPLPEDWLVYAALDVEVLIELRDLLAGMLAEQGKSEFAAQEFEAVRTAAAPAPRAEPWRRTSGIHKVRKPRALAVVRALWEARDKLAAERDIAPGRVLPDAAIVDAAVNAPATPGALAAMPVFRGRSQRRLTSYWFAALERAAQLPAEELPRATVPGDGPPPVARWSDRDPDAAARLSAARSALADLAEKWSIPVENLLLPDLLRRLCWTPPADGDVAAALAAGGARPWQIALTAPLLEKAVAAKA
ncbi:3'-5' exonuclease [Pseudonocardia dioxanivorans CB1190]|uniref:3'-5' exonuclease n=1 Tax=Pseudonocardia dioxanivorans (strain ATCC 55486 / DSM 44775 / JCM 13855 / CB1190) TaxID=675635 RepID=F4CMZ2_PSEUX|nr:HRDC domain-containing protein [Pseudonocardia dioxanivorans]AEA25091.1 3'-5' exonuclease [Pseudonocardia dioxanivorans CB1190]